MRGKYLSVDGEYVKSGLFAEHKIVSVCEYLNVFGECAERIYAYMEKTQKGYWRILLIRHEI
jgi:hypothetical protein